MVLDGGVVVLIVEIVTLILDHMEVVVDLDIFNQMINLFIIISLTHIL